MRIIRRIYENQNNKKIVDSNEREFKISDDIFFKLMRNDKVYDCFGIITDINEEEFSINNVMIDKMNVLDKLTIKYAEVKEGILEHTASGWG